VYGREILIELDYMCQFSSIKKSGAKIRPSPAKKSRGLDIDASCFSWKNWREAEDAIERTCLEDPAFPGINRTGNPLSYS
jgi:hypothetical protein